MSFIDRGDTLARMLWVVETLRRRSTLSFHDYNERWECSRRSFRRDIERLRRAGYVIHGTRSGSVDNPIVRLESWLKDVAA